MASKVQHLPPAGRGQRKSIYNWREWTDGNIWKARYGDDFRCRPVSFVQQLHKEAKDRGMKCHARNGRDADNRRTVTFQFYRP